MEHFEEHAKAAGFLAASVSEAGSNGLIFLGGHGFEQRDLLDHHFLDEVNATEKGEYAIGIFLLQKMMIQQIAVLETMSPKEYKAIRTRLGNGSGQESPGFRVLLKMFQPIWNSFKSSYLEKHQLTLEKIYDSEYSHSDAYVVAEALAEFDALFQKFRYEHMQLIHRTIGFGAKSLKGRAVEILEEGMRQKFFPELWEIRGQMTDKWGAQYGIKRDPLGPHH